MKSKTLMSMVVAGSLFSAVAFGQTLQISGRVTALTSSQITLQAGLDTWAIARTSDTSVTNGTLAVGSMVTVKCNSPDAHKNESPQGGTPTPSGS